MSGLLLVSCQSGQPETVEAGESLGHVLALESETAVSTPAARQNPPPPPVTPLSESSPLPPPATLTPIPTEIKPTPIPPTEVVPTPTATPIGVCSQRIPSDDLFTLVTQTYNLSRDYAPQDIVLLTDFLPMDVTLGYPSEIREIALQPLLAMIADMKAAGLQPQILSGYRSFYAQSVAWDKWSKEVPDHVSIISARPGHSEHQLGTVVDFGSPALPEIVGEARYPVPHLFL